LINLFKKSEPGSSDEKKILSFSIIVSLILLLADQITKVLIVHSFKLGEKLVVIPGCFDLTYITNKGAAWGILHGYGWLLLLIAIAVFCVALFMMRWLTEGWNDRYLMLFIVLSGIVGNSIDRIWRGEVVDFLDFYLGSSHWPAFNVADSAICVGAGIFFLSVFFRPSRQVVKKQEQDKTTA
jgi:signal peptidase II